MVGFRVFLTFRIRKNKKNIYKERVLEKRHKPTTTLRKGGINYKDRFQKNVTRRVRTV